MGDLKPRVFYTDDEVQEKHVDLFHNSYRVSPPKLLPPGLTRADFDDVLKAFRQIVGTENVYTEVDLVDYLDPFELWEDSDKRHVPSAAICPCSVRDIQDILAVANKYKVPLWTISRGKNLGYGGPSPRVSGSVILDLHKMQRIIEVNDKLAYCVIEPGVTFFDLYEHCRKKKLKVWPSAPSLGWGSPMGNALDRGFGYTRHGSHHDQICGMEVVLPNGEIIRTGQFAIPNGAAAHLSKSSYGPSIDGLFLQSNLGVVTRIGLWMTPQPEAFMSCSMSVDEDHELEAMIDTLSELKRHDILQNPPIVRNIVAWSSTAGARKDFYSGTGVMSHEDLKAIQKKLNIGYWMCKFAFYGPKELCEQRFAAAKELIDKRAPYAKLTYDLHVGRNGERVDAASIPASQGGGGMAGVPDLWTLGVLRYRSADNPDGIGGHIDFSPTLPADGKTVASWYIAAKAITAKYGFDTYIGATINDRTFIMVHQFIYDKTKPEYRQNLDKLMVDLVAEAQKRGISPYRSHLNQMDLFQNMYEFNNHAYRRFVEKLKDFMDPNGILSPGKNGIWPSRMKGLSLVKRNDERHQSKL